MRKTDQPNELAIVARYRSVRDGLAKRESDVAELDAAWERFSAARRLAMLPNAERAAVWRVRCVEAFRALRTLMDRIEGIDRDEKL